jgi:hypothetical protein
VTLGIQSRNTYGIIELLSQHTTFWHLILGESTIRHEDDHTFVHYNAMISPTASFHRTDKHPSIRNIRSSLGRHTFVVARFLISARRFGRTSCLAFDDVGRVDGIIIILLWRTG